ELEKLAHKIHRSFERSDEPPDADAVERAIGLLDRGEIRVAEPPSNADPTAEWTLHAWVKEAVLLYFRVRGLETTSVGPFEYHDQLPLKTGHAGRGVRVVPPGVA